MHIREMRATDLPPIKEILLATDLLPPELLDGMAEPFLAGERPADRWTVAEDGGAPIALAYCAPEPLTEGTSNLLLIAVAPEAQGRGVGRALIEDLERALRAAGRRLLLVETSGLPEFARTRLVYAGLGFTEEARIREYYGPGEDKVVFWKALAPDPGQG